MCCLSSLGQTHKSSYTEIMPPRNTYPSQIMMPVIHPEVNQHGKRDSLQCSNDVPLFNVLFPLAISVYQQIFRPFPTSIFSTIFTSGIKIRNTAHIYYHPLTRKSSNYVPVTQHWWLSAKCPCPRSYLEEQLPLSWSLKHRSSKKDSLQNSPQLLSDFGDSGTLWTIWFSSFYFSIYRICHHL